MGFLFRRKAAGKPPPPQDLLARLEKMEARLKEPAPGQNRVPYPDRPGPYPSSGAGSAYV